MHRLVLIAFAGHPVTVTYLVAATRALTIAAGTWPLEEPRRGQRIVERAGEIQLDGLAPPAARQQKHPDRAENAMVNISQAETDKELDDVRQLMRQFVAWHRKRNIRNIKLVDEYFDQTEFDKELAGLPGQYAPPKGRLLVAYHGDEPAGCVALRDLGDGSCEMKRMFVPSEFRGICIGRALADRVMEEAKQAGYARMRLDTSTNQKEAIHLYESAGFTPIKPYYPLPDAMKDWLLFFERKL